MDYTSFIKEHGIPLARLNPGSDEYALNTDDALYAIDLLKTHEVAIVGGDIMSKKDDSLIYAYQLWGSKYQSLNWYCSRDSGESDPDYAKRTYELARTKIEEAKNVADSLNYPCLIVLVTTNW